MLQGSSYNGAGGRAPPGARGLKQREILKPIRRGVSLPVLRRAPHGARGLKQGEFLHAMGISRSRAPHGARGLKHGYRHIHRFISGRAPHGARGLKLTDEAEGMVAVRRAPHGARGLKPCMKPLTMGKKPSPPTTGALIETIM